VILGKGRRRYFGLFTFLTGAPMRHCHREARRCNVNCASRRKSAFAGHRASHGAHETAAAEGASVMKKSAPNPTIPAEVVLQLDKLAETLKFWAARNAEAPTEAEAQMTLQKVERHAHKLAVELTDIDPIPRAYVVAHLSAEEVDSFILALTRLQVAVIKGIDDLEKVIATQRENAKRAKEEGAELGRAGLPRFAARNVVALFEKAGLRVTCGGGKARPTLAMWALSSVLDKAGAPLGMDSVVRYLKIAQVESRKQAN